MPLVERSRTIPLPSRLRDMPVYRPAPYLALIAILLPATAAGVASALLLDENQRTPVWIPVLILLFIPMLAVAWLFMRSVRLSPVGIAVGRPFQRWREAPWHEITRAERRGMFIRIYTRGGDAIAFAPRLLADSNDLLKTLLDHLAPQVLDGALRMEAMDHMRIPVSESGISSMLRARARNRWPLGGFFLTVMGIAGGVLSIFMIPLPLSIVICVVGALLALLGTAIGVWFLQEIIVTREGLTIIRPWQSSPEEVTWDEVKVLDHSARWGLLRFRAGRLVRCIGPGVLGEPERDRMLVFINHYCLQRGVVAYPHRGLF